MTALTSGLVGIACLLLLTAVGVPVGIAIAAVGIVGMAVTGGLDFMLATLTTLPYQTTSHYNFVVIPMFVLMGSIASSAGIVSEVYAAAYRWTAGIRGGLFTATTLASAGFAAVSGSTVVNAAVFTRIALPEMIKFGYDRGVGGGGIAAAGTFAALIPPSLSFVIYGILTGESIGRLLMAGVLPGLLTVAGYLLVIPVMVRLRPHWAPPPVERFSIGEKLASLRGVWPMMLLITLVLGGIYGGFMPPSAAGAVGAAGALVIAFAKRKLPFGTLTTSLRETALLTGSLFIIIIGGLIFTRFLTISGFIAAANAFVVAADFTPLQFMIALTVFYFILGMFIDPISMLAMTIPFIYPIAMTLGLDAIWLGVITVKMIEIAVITPPVGINLFAVVAASDGKLKTSEVFRGILPFVVIELFILVLLIAFPDVSTWLPTTMTGR